MRQGNYPWTPYGGGNGLWPYGPIPWPYPFENQREYQDFQVYPEDRDRYARGDSPSHHYPRERRSLGRESPERRLPRAESRRNELDRRDKKERRHSERPSSLEREHESKRLRTEERRSPRSERTPHRVEERNISSRRSPREEKSPHDLRNRDYREERPTSRSPSRPPRHLSADRSPRVPERVEYSREPERDRRRSSVDEPKKDSAKPDINPRTQVDLEPSRERKREVIEDRRSDHVSSTPSRSESSRSSNTLDRRQDLPSPRKEVATNQSAEDPHRHDETTIFTSCDYCEKKVEQLKVRQCKTCEQDLCRSCQSFCQICEKPLCPDCKYRCATPHSTRVYLCDDHIAFCTLCNGIMCQRCNRECESCGTKICYNCSKNSNCPDCANEKKKIVPKPKETRLGKQGSNKQDIKMDQTSPRAQKISGSETNKEEKLVPTSEDIQKPNVFRESRNKMVPNKSESTSGSKVDTRSRTQGDYDSSKKVVSDSRKSLGVSKSETTMVKIDTEETSTTKTIKSETAITPADKTIVIDPHTSEKESNSTNNSNTELGNRVVSVGSSAVTTQNRPSMEESLSSSQERISKPEINSSEDLQDLKLQSSHSLETLKSEQLTQSVKPESTPQGLNSADRLKKRQERFGVVEVEPKQSSRPQGRTQSGKTEWKEVDMKQKQKNPPEFTGNRRQMNQGNWSKLTGRNNKRRQKP